MHHSHLTTRPCSKIYLVDVYLFILFTLCTFKDKLFDVAESLSWWKLWEFPPPTFFGILKKCWPVWPWLLVVIRVLYVIWWFILPLRFRAACSPRSVFLLPDCPIEWRWLLRNATPGVPVDTVRNRWAHVGRAAGVGVGSAYSWSHHTVTNKLDYLKKSKTKQYTLTTWQRHVGF